VENASGKSRAAVASDAQRARSTEYIKRNWLVISFASQDHNTEKVGQNIYSIAKFHNLEA
jgi:hypothetical protein